MTQALEKVPQSREWQSTLDPETSARIKARVMSYVMAHGGQPAKTLSFAQKFRMNFNIAAHLVPQGFAYAMALFVLLAGSAVFAGYARQARPGQSLYGAKIALEKTHVRFVSNPANRAQVQMELAGRRLEEAQNAVSVEQEAKVLRQFSRDVKEARSTLKQAGDPAQVQAATRELVKKAQEYEEKLSETKSKKPAREVDLAAISEAEEALLEIRGELVKITIPEPGALPVQPSDQFPKTDQATEVEELQVGEVSL